MEAHIEKGDKEKGEQKIAAVVGGSSGIGRETAIKLVSGGYRVYNISRTPCTAEGVENVAADASKEGELAAAISSIGNEDGVIDVLVYSAGFSMAAPIEHVENDDYRYLFEVNYFGAIEAIKAAVPFLKKRGGRVVLVGSIGGDMPIPFDGCYSSSKAALAMLAREADIELRPYGVNVSTVLPGGTATDFTFKRKIYAAETNREYAYALGRATAVLADTEQGGDDPKLVADEIIKTIERKDPPRISAAGGLNKVLHFVCKTMPTRLTDWCVRKMFKQK